MAHVNQPVSESMSTLLNDEIEPHCRFDDLRDARIVENWQQVRRLQETEGFPLGRLLSPNTRAWTVAEIKQWLATRPIERKVVAPRKKHAT
jgi:hypothetical protein